MPRGLFRDLRSGLTPLRRRWLFAVLTTVTLALAIAANTTIFALWSAPMRWIER
jgi:hypothetical protein